jgi:CheY-specific phosphatase CheX
MQDVEENILALSENIWLTVLGLPIGRSDLAYNALPPGATLDGIVTISGDWQGTVIVQLPRALAQRAAGIMFSLDPTDTTLADMQDALGEITNMTGGHLKALMDGTCHLSLPAVVEGRDYSIRIPSAHALCRLVIDCEGLPAVISLIAAGARP